jgi:hypothetical protein
MEIIHAILTCYHGKDKPSFRAKKDMLGDFAGNALVITTSMDVNVKFVATRSPISFLSCIRFCLLFFCHSFFSSAYYRYLAIMTALAIAGWRVAPGRSAAISISVFHLQSLYVLLMSGITTNIGQKFFQLSSSPTTFSVTAIECIFPWYFYFYF